MASNIKNLPSSPRKRRHVEKPVDLTSFFCKNGDRPNKPRFMTMTCAEDDKTFKSVSACRLARAIDDVAGTLQSVVRQRNGDILLEARTDTQIDLLLSITTLAGLQVKVTTHPTLNLCKGVVTHEDFSTESEKDLKTFFESEGVVDIYRMKRKVDGKLIPSSTLVLTFDRPVLPEKIRCGFFNLRVRQYIPNPLRCFKCQRFGHTQQRCLALHQICMLCGQQAHETSKCLSPPKCVNCEGNHPSNSKNCDKFQMEMEIQKIRVVEKVSFPEARRRYQIKHPVALVKSFSAVVRPPVNQTSISCQTDNQKMVTSHPLHSVHCQVSAHQILALASATLPLGTKVIIPTKYKSAPKLDTFTVEVSTSTDGSRKSLEEDHSLPSPSEKEFRSKSRSPIAAGDRKCERNSEFLSNSDPDDPAANNAQSQILNYKHHRRKKKK